MKLAYRLFKRGNIFYSENTITKQQASLRTSSQFEAERLVAAKNEAAKENTLALAVGQIYLSAADPALMTRTWSDVMKVMIQRGGESTQARTSRAFDSKPFNLIRHKVIHQTHSTDFLAVLKNKRRQTIHYLRLLQSMAVNLGWLNGRVILAKHCWPRIPAKSKRAITWDEHQKIVAAEIKNKERRLYYEMLWEIGSSQLDAAQLSSENIVGDVLVYSREKTGTQASIRIGERLKHILHELPAEGLFFPKIASLNSVARSAEFNRRCRLLSIVGVSLHSYRYAWAERAFSVGYPERFAQAALGHDSRAIHHAYARKAKVVCPALDEFTSPKC
jgi:hypothetical protein